MSDFYAESTELRGAVPAAALGRPAGAAARRRSGTAAGSRREALARGRRRARPDAGVAAGRSRPSTTCTTPSPSAGTWSRSARTSPARSSARSRCSRRSSASSASRRARRREDGEFTLRTIECARRLRLRGRRPVDQRYREPVKAEDVPGDRGGAAAWRTEELTLARRGRARPDASSPTTRRSAATSRSRRRARWSRRRVIDELLAVEPARPRRRRLPDGPQGELPRRRDSPSRTTCRQRGRVRAGHVQGPRDHAARPAPADRGLPDHGARDRSQNVFIYIRGEYLDEFEVMRAALDEAREAGPARRRHDRAAPRRRRLHLRRGDGAARVARGQARPAALEAAVPRDAAGSTRSPTLINNVETIATVPPIVEHGGEWYAKIGRRDLAGTRVFSLSGNVANGGQLRARARHAAARADLRASAAASRTARELKAIIPGGSSMPVLTRRRGRHAARLQRGRASRARMLGSARRDRDRRPRLHGAARRCASRSSTCTSPAASARRAARGRAGWCSCCAKLEDGRARAGRARPAALASATGSSASASARSATPPRCRSRATWTSSATSSRRTSTRAAARSAASRRSRAILAPVDQHHHSPRRRGPGVSAPELVTLTVDGREVQVPKGTGLVETALAAGVEIPVFCYEPRLGPPVGACRMCLVRDRGDAEAPGRAAR